MMSQQDSQLDRLYELLPVVYRQRDLELGQPLRALLQIISEQVNLVEADIAQLYENWFIETCQDWVVPYIADLIGYQSIHEAGQPGSPTTPQGLQRNKILMPRRDVANTLRDRRRKGTLALLELLARDVAGWPARSVEFYQLVAAAQHLNHLRLGRARTLDLRAGDALDRLDGAFVESAHTVGIRRLNSSHSTGRPNITGTGLFIWRLKSYSVTRAQAHCVDSVRNHYTFSMLGNNTPLFTKPVEEPDPTHIADEMNVPAPIRRRAFDEHLANYYGRGKSIYIWRDGLSNPVILDQIISADLSKWAYRPQGDQVAVDPRLGRIVFASRAAPKAGVWVTYHYGFSADIGGGEYDRHLRPPGNRKVYRVSQQFQAKSYSPTINEALEKWRSDQPEDAIIQIEDSGTYVEQIDIRLSDNQRLEIRAANRTRPVIRLLDWYTNRPDSLGIGGQSSLDLDQTDEALDDQGGQDEAGSEQREPTLPPRLTLDGLLIAGRSIHIYGNLAEVLIRHCTLVPGWSLDRHCNPENEIEPSIELMDTNAQLTIEHSIVGSIQVNANEVATDPVSIQITDSILDATSAKLNALYGPDDTIAHAQLRILRTTVLGLVTTHAITLAENSIFDGHVFVARSQIGCMRFCYVPRGSRTPRRYNCQPDLVLNGLDDDDRKDEAARRVSPQFNSRRYGTPAYCQLAETCAPEITRGADDESEMGVFHDLFQPQREANLRARLEEYVPAGMDTGLIFAT
ncbi:MAG: hypothetical protein WCF57_08585 [Pyrinomonadaceae bacterium]